MSADTAPTYIEDSERAYVIAHASKEERCLIVASRLVDKVLADIHGDDDNIASAALASVDLVDIYNIYPEAFRHVPKSKLLGKPKEMLDALPFIIKHGGLPIEEDNWSTYKISTMELETEAEQKEAIAEALLDSPPTDDFLRDHNLSRLRHDKDKVGVIAQLTKSFEYLRKEADEYEKKTVRFFERYESGESDNPKLKIIIYELENTVLELESHIKDNEFSEEVKQALNNPTTTLTDLEQLLRDGKNRVITGYRQRADRELVKYHAIMSGDASKYKSDTTES